MKRLSERWAGSKGLLRVLCGFSPRSLRLRTPRPSANCFQFPAKFCTLRHCATVLGQFQFPQGASMIKPLPRKSGKPWPWNAIPEPRPADWGIGMTVCIAAHCYEEGSEDECVMCATDALVSTGEMSADHSARKMQRIGQGWFAMFAGDDISSLTPILDHVRDVVGDARSSRDKIAGAFVAAYKEQLKLRAENGTLAAVGYSLGEFKRSGLAQLGAENFTRILYEIERQTIDLQFLLAGVDEAGQFHLVTITSPGKVDYYTELGFWAIGTGQTQALGSMFSTSRRLRFIGRAAALYRICEAKFSAENAIGVGPTTIVGIIKKDAKGRYISTVLVEKLRPIWEETRVIEVPAKAEALAKEFLKNLEQ